MFWQNGNYPTVYQNQPLRLRQKAIQIANNMMKVGIDEKQAIEIGLRKAREFFLSQHPQRSVDADLPAFP